ncbi:forkhead box protein I1 [Eurytemora carolleeae]|uniref:forkhead box protein I1 n=1 Tax=Eurytemora carolleeae TaxID=1294199 RepID=UPI000C75C1A0|nr:forkhead box protein I1 [Eurytemora carolleeae]|eukprot:XP_023346372.1 forkhead box protein I1-like [Eurytemora affinis]
MEHRTSPAPSLQAPVSSSQDTVRLQHLYTLAFADRMRLLQPFSPFPPLLTPPMIPRFAPPPDLAMFPMAKLDPRLFRIPFPEEPKPQHSYIGLIAMSILSSVEKKLVLADIYQYILDNFPYFRHRGPGWRNSIRHNLSLNDCFIKAGRASNGKGHYWAVHPACQQDFQKGDFSRRKAQRRVRKYLGMNVGLDEEDTPPSSPVLDTSDRFDSDDSFKVDSGFIKMEPSSSSSSYTSYVIPCSPTRDPSPPPAPSKTQSSETLKRSFSFGIDSLLQKEDKKPRLYLFKGE